jgi:hypothetical protein
MRKQHGIDLAEAWIIRAAYREPCVVEDAGTVRIFENQCPIEAAELTIVTAERRDLYRAGADGGAGCLSRCIGTSTASAAAIKAIAALVIARLPK